MHIVDAETGRGVPLVELRTPNAVAFWTDSNGVAVIDDPAFQDHDVAFVIHSDGYEFPGKLMIGEDSGRILQVRPGFHDELKIRRLNIAERLYRITGADIYRDSVLAGLKAPIAQPILDGGVVGQDTNVAIPYQGKIFWCWEYFVREEPNRIGNAYLFRTGYGIPVVLADFNCPGVIKQHFQMTQLLRHDPGDSFSRFWLSVTSFVRTEKWR